MQNSVDKMIVSLWKVPDREPSEMMICFYQNLITTKNYSNAFRTAQKQMMEKYRTNPELWAGFVLVE
jgi:CHAT domain-containing protein